MEKIIENTGTAQVHGQLTKFKVFPTFFAKNIII